MSLLEFDLNSQVNNSFIQMDDDNNEELSLQPNDFHTESLQQQNYSNLQDQQNERVASWASNSYESLKCSLSHMNDMEHNDNLLPPVELSENITFEVTSNVQFIAKFERFYEVIVKNYSCDTEYYIHQVIALLQQWGNLKNIKFQSICSLNYKELQSVCQCFIQCLEMELGNYMKQFQMSNLITNNGSPKTYAFEFVMMKRILYTSISHLKQVYEGMLEINSQANLISQHIQNKSLTDDQNSNNNNCNGDALLLQSLENSDNNDNNWDKINNVFKITKPLVLFEADEFAFIINMSFKKIDSLGLIRYNSDFLEEKTVFHEDVHYGTCAYQVHKSIKDFLEELCSLELPHMLFEYYFSNGGLRANLINTLEKDQHIKDFDPAFGVMSFKSHIYIAETDQFYNHWDPCKPKGIMAMKYIDDELDTRPIMHSCMDLAMDPLDPTKPMPLVALFRDQSYSDLEIEFACFLLGRLIYPFRYDDRQIFVYIKGVAGTGKSSLIDLIRSFFAQSDVCSMGNKTEERFETWHMADAKLIVAPDLTEHATFDKANLLSLVTGEKMSINAKNLQSKDKIIKANLLCGGNKYPNKWNDTVGDVVRRMLNLDFLIPPPRINEKFKDQLKNSGGHAYRFLNVAFLHVHRNMRDLAENPSEFWENLPERFWENTRKFVANNNKVLAFLLDNCDYIEYASTYQTLAVDFKTHFDNWCQYNVYSENNYYEKLKQALKNMHCSIVNREWIKGLRFTAIPLTSSNSNQSAVTSSSS